MGINTLLKRLFWVFSLLFLLFILLRYYPIIYHPDPHPGQNIWVEGGPYSYVVIGANNQQIARHVTNADACPLINIDGQLMPMQQRGQDNPPMGFEPVISCEYLLPTSVNSVMIEQQPLAVLPKTIQRIAIIGDTGCRMKVIAFQNCNNLLDGGDPWPFAEIIAMVAAEEPDVVLHMGDYHYRETPCPVFDASCRGPWGYNWGAWQADFFEPAQPLLNKVPWLLTRGNHEDCQRAYKGWFYLLDPYPLLNNIWENCRDFMPPYSVELNDLLVVQLDSATDVRSKQSSVNPFTTYRQMFDEVNQLAANGDQAWLITHRPLWGIASYYDWQALENQITITDLGMQKALQQSTLGHLADPINLILSGHVHNFQAISYQDQRASLMVVGGSGTQLSPLITNELQPKLAQLLADLTVKPDDFFIDGGFAYVIMERHNDQEWLVNFMSLDAKQPRMFILNGKKLRPLPSET